MKKIERRWRKRKLEVITWADACASNEWLFKDGVDEQFHDHLLVTTVGWVIREDKKAVAVAATITSDDSRVGQLFRIPRPFIVSRAVIKT